MATAGRRVLCSPRWNRILAAALDGLRVDAAFQTTRVACLANVAARAFGLGRCSVELAVSRFLGRNTRELSACARGWRGSWECWWERC